MRMLITTASICAIFLVSSACGRNQRPHETAHTELTSNDDVVVRSALYNARQWFNGDAGEAESLPRIRSVILKLLNEEKNAETLRAALFASVNAPKLGITANAESRQIFMDALGRYNAIAKGEVLRLTKDETSGQSFLAVSQFRR